MQVKTQRIHRNGADPEKEIEVLEGCTVAEAVAIAGYPVDEGYWYFVNGNGACLSQVLLTNDVIAMAPEIQGG
jgi:hypothetical protein